MPLPIYDNQAAVPAADAADFVEYKGKWHQKDYVAALTESERVKGINATLIGEKSAAEKRADDEKKRADDLAAATATGKTQQELDAYVKPTQDKLTAAETKNVDLQTKLDRVEMERLTLAVALSKDVGMMPERLADPDNMEIVLRGMKLHNGALAVKDKDGNITTTPVAEYLKAIKATKPYLFAHPGTTGGGALHNAGTSPTGERNAKDDVKKINEERSATPNPLALKVAKV